MLIHVPDQIGMDRDRDKLIMQFQSVPSNEFSPSQTLHHATLAFLDVSNMATGWGHKLLPLINRLNRFPIA
jgi:hypothetical protein